MKITKIGTAGLDLIKKFESFSAKPYPDPGTGGVPYTIGYGSTYYEDGTKVKLSDPPISEARASALLLNLLRSYEMAVDSFCRDDINQQQFDALCSFSYNVGTAALKGSTLLKKLNVNPGDPSIRDEFLKWNRAGGRPLRGLTRRREAEAELYFSK